jgi:bifunctional non-homologous end joining protein LigD
MTAELSLEKLTKVKLTNLDKVLFPKLSATKSQVIEYYVRVAPRMLSFLHGRPVVVNRFPDGVESEGFYEKDSPRGTPSWVKTYRRYSDTAQRELSYIICDDLDTLVWLANLASLELHITLSRAETFENPDFVFFDLDPEPPSGFQQAVEIALAVKKELDGLGFRTYVKTSGKKGLHLLLPIAEGYTFRQTREFAHTVGKFLSHEFPEVVSEVKESTKPGTVYIDYMQNSQGRTMACPYSLRSVENGAVSTPLEWSELRKGLRPEAFTLFSVPKRESNPWGGLLKDKQKLEL